MKTLITVFAAIILFACTKSPVEIPDQPVQFRSTFIVSGKIVWEHDTTQGVGLVTVKLTGPETQTVVTNSSGLFTFSVSTSGTYTVTPTKTVNLLNGVTGVLGGDATLIQNHVANLALLPTAYKVVAADANKNGILTSLDASIVNQAYLGSPAAQTQLSPSWTFVDRSYVFGSVPPIPNYPKAKTFSVSSDVTQVDFVGIKRGDVNGSADPSQ